MMEKKLVILLILAFQLSGFCADYNVDFSKMTKLWCTLDYRHWAVNYADNLNFTQLDFFVYLDEINNKIYNDEKQPTTNVSFGEKEISFTNTYREDKKTYVENYQIDRYTGRAKAKGTIRHDYGAWASMTYSNRDFDAKGQCSTQAKEKKF